MPRKQVVAAALQVPKTKALMCAMPGCPYDAMVRVKRHKAEWVAGKRNPVHKPYGAWLDLCHSCDDKRHHQESIEYCNLMGLDTVEKQKAWCLKNFKRGKDMLLPAPREPGQDDEWMDDSLASQA